MSPRVLDDVRRTSDGSRQDQGASDMRFVVHGAGGIGGVLAARLFQAGSAVVGIARGAPLDAGRANGRRLQWGDEDVVLDVRGGGPPGGGGVTADDVVILTMKSQDTV